MDIAANINRPDDYQAIKYLGRYKPNRTYPIGNGLLILPAGSEMVEYRSSSSINQIQHNISYLASENKMPQLELMEKYREWLAFDAFVLNDDSQIRAFDAHKTGQIEMVPRGVPKAQTITHYFQPDYDNIFVAMSGGRTSDSQGLPPVRYSDLYQSYLSLPLDTKEQIEWYVSFPKYLSDSAFFHPNYWRILQTMILIDQMIGLPAPCPQSPKMCDCGSPLQTHHAMPRRDWLRQFITSRINDDQIANDYVLTIQTGYNFRNKIAHSPQFDRSTHEAPLEQPEIYDVNRATTDFKHDSAALSLLVLSLDDVARNILLNKAFNINFFAPLRKLTSFPVR